MGSKTLGGFALPDGEFAGAGYLCAAYSRQRLASLAYHQQSWFGGTFMGTTSLVMTIARQLSVPGNLNLLGFVTLIYGIGQILGPALTSMLGNGTSALASATLCGAAALFIAALISTVQLFKLQVVTS
ncbi:putative permease [Escherichia coli]|nr:putative permease [Escherichia coli]